MLHQWEEFLFYMFTIITDKLLQDVIKHYFSRDYLHTYMKSVGIGNFEIGVIHRSANDQIFCIR